MTEALPVVYLARHGKTAWSIAGRHTGLTDLPLTPPGKRNGRRGSRLQGLAFAKIFASPLQRALYFEALAAPLTVNTMPEATSKAFADHGAIGAAMPVDGGDCEATLAAVAKTGVDIDTLATRFQDKGASSLVKSWNELMAVIAPKCAVLEKVG